MAVLEKVFLKEAFPTENFEEFFRPKKTFLLKADCSWKDILYWKNFKKLDINMSFNSPSGYRCR